MALELRQHLKLTQQLVMTPQLQQAIKLLQLSRLELQETIEQEIEQNPLLEDSLEGRDDFTSYSEEEPELAIPEVSLSPADEGPWGDEPIKDTDWSEYSDYFDNERSSAVMSFAYEEKEPISFEGSVSGPTSLTSHLMWQLQLSDLEEVDRLVAAHIIGNLDPNGYLAVPIEDIAREAGVTEAKVLEVLAKVQEFDPVGVAARDLRECLLIQIRHLGLEGSVVEKIVRDHLKSLELKNYQAIARELDISLEEVVQAVEVISQLEPRPGRNYSGEATHYIVPDIFVYKVDDDYVIVLNDEGLPRLRISPHYRRLLQDPSVPLETKQYIQKKLRSALWLIKSLHQRQRTIYRVTESIMRFQREFLDKGIAYLRPLILKDVAEDVGMHESTISRVTTGKYVQTPQGLFELKFFFNTGINRVGGDQVSSQSVRERIKQIIQTEDPTKPFSDQKIANLLKERYGIEIARRTVAKYREMMGILPASRRKRPALSTK